MLFAEHLCVLRGGGDLATGVAWRLTRAGVPVGILELPAPLTVRRTVALSSAVTEGETVVEGLVARRVDRPEQFAALARTGVVPVLVAPTLAALADTGGAPGATPSVLVDARLAKRNLDTTRADAPLVVGLGPGFVAGADCHAVVETMRGHHLGRVLWDGAAAADTGTPGEVGGQGAARVVRAPAAGVVRWDVAIGEVVAADVLLGAVDGQELRAPFAGVVRGLIAHGTSVPAGLKIGDVDPRADTDCHQISDKALAVGGGVVEAVLTWLGETRG